MSRLSSIQAAMSPSLISWDRIGSSFERQLHKPYNDQVLDFESRLAAYLEVEKTIALNSGTSAIHLALQLVGVSAGDVVLCSDFSFVASANPIKYLGAEPVFIDCEHITWNMDPQLLEKAIKDQLEKGRKPKAIIVVHIYGNPAKLDSILHVAETYKIPVIEDAAQAFGSEYRGQKVGTFADFGAYSFNNNKIFTTLGGGALVAKDLNMINQAKYLASQAKEPVDHYSHRQVGYNYLMSPLNASLGYSALPLVEEEINRKRETFQRYQSILKQNQRVRYQQEIEGASSNRWTFSIDAGSEKYRKHFEAALNIAGCTTRRLWKPLSTQPVYNETTSYGKGVASGLFVTGLSLPARLEAEAEHLLNDIR